jgi:TolA-binding protein
MRSPWLSALFPALPLALALSLPPALIARPALAQMESREGIALQNQIYQLRQELQILRDQGGGGSFTSRGAPPPSGGNDLTAQLLTRVDALEDQVRQLRGQIDEARNLMQRQYADLNKRLEDLAFQTGQQAPPAAPAENLGPTSPPPTTLQLPPRGPGATRPPASIPGGWPPPGPGAIPGAGPVNPPASRPRTPEIAMQEGNAALARRDYAAAEQAAREVLSNRTSPRAYEAQLLLAQSLSGQRQYSQAAIAFDDAYNRSRKGTHAQDALLGLANALTSINEKRAACDTLVRLRVEFPQPRGDLRDGIAAAGQRAGCR